MSLTKIFNLFIDKNNDLPENNLNFFENKKKHFNLFFGVLLAAIAVFTLSLFINGLNITNNQKTKTMVEIPFKEEISTEDIEKIKIIASNILGTNCVIQTSKASEFSNLFQKNNLVNNLVISFNKNEKNKSDLNYKIFQIGEKLKQEFPKNIDIEFKEEIFVSDVDIKKSYNLDIKTAIFVAILIVFVVLLCYIFAFRKIGGFVVAFSFLIAIVFNTMVTLAFFFSLAGVLNFKVNNIFMWSFISTIVACFINYICNSALLFTKIKNENNEKYEETLKTSNIAINKNFRALINNSVILTIVPTCTMFICKIVESVIYQNLNILVEAMPFIAIYLLLGFLCLIVSIYILIPLWVTLKKRKPKKKNI